MSEAEERGFSPPQPLSSPPVFTALPPALTPESTVDVPWEATGDFPDVHVKTSEHSGMKRKQPA